MREIKKMVTVIAIILVIVFGLAWFFKPHYVELELVTSIQNSTITINADKNSFHEEVHWWFLNEQPFEITNATLRTVSPCVYDGMLSPEKLVSWGIDFDKLGIDFDELGIDFEKHNVIIAFSREIKEMQFKRSTEFPFKILSTVKTIMSKNLNANTLYIYKIPKYDISEDARAYSETTIESS